MDERKTYEQQEWISPYRAAQITGGSVHRSTIAAWAEEGLIEAIRLPNGYYRVSRKAVEAFMTPIKPTHPLVDPGQLSLLDEAV